MSEQHTSPLDFFPDEFLAENDAAVSPLTSGARDISRVANGTTLEVIGDTATEALQNPRVASGVAAGTLLASTISSVVNPVLAAAQNFSSRGPLVHHTAHTTKSSGDHLDEVSFILQPGGSIYPIAVEEDPVMGVSVDEAEAQIETASNIAPSQVTDLAIGTEIEVPLHYKFAAVPEGRDLDWMDAQHDMTLEQDLEVNPTYRAHPNDVQAGAVILVDTSTRTTVTAAPAPHPQHHEHHHVSTTPLTGGVEAPAPEKPAAPVAQHKTAAVPKAALAPIQPHHLQTVAPKERTQPEPKPTHHAQPKVRSTAGPVFGKGLQLDLGKAFSTAGTASAEQTHRAAQNTVGHIASMTQEILEGITPSRTQHSSHTAPVHVKRPAATPTHSEKSLPPNAGEKYNIYSNVLDKSGFSAPALQYALSQMEGGSMADLAGDIHYVEKEYGINSLYVAAAGCIESACGTSNFARERNNYFGIEAYTDNPDAASTFKSKRDNVIAFAQLLHNNYLHPGAQYWGGSGSLHSIYKNYSTSHDSEALSISEVMNTLAAHASYYDEMHGSTNDAVTPTAHLQPRHSSHHRSATRKHEKVHHSGGSSTITSLYKALAHAWENPLG